PHLWLVGGEPLAGILLRERVRYPRPARDLGVSAGSNDRGDVSPVPGPKLHKAITQLRHWWLKGAGFHTVDTTATGPAPGQGEVRRQLQDGAEAGSPSARGSGSSASRAWTRSAMSATMTLTAARLRPWGSGTAQS